MIKRGGLAILAVVLLSTWGISWLFSDKASPLFKPIEHYELAGELHFIQPEAVDQVLNHYFGFSFWQVNLDEIQSDLVQLEWVSQAVVKRQWPNRLYVAIEEQKPVARWGGSGLINQTGEVFFPKERGEFNALVLLEGEEVDAKKMLSALVVFQAQLNAIEFTIVSLKHQLDGVWWIRLLNGSEIVLDSKKGEYKLETFIAAYPQLAKTLRKSAQVYDLRYSNGFIVGNAQ
ncbi:MAG: FtsQ-type POTRA domain-containing protein [Thiomicrorhabdus sp.]|nr:FtsQ-type POTRA domain-containing protein [Thiomicrorhabdus sp.]